MPTPLQHHTACAAAKTACHPRRFALALLASTMATAAKAEMVAATCEARTGNTPVAVVELYTSEGCSSCPPADRWFSTLKPEDGVLALAFHASYWNHLGWLDHFATPETTARQHRIREALGAPYVYTPQVLLNGQDHGGWNGQRANGLRALLTASAPSLHLSRNGHTVTAEIGASRGHTAIAGYWAVLQDGLASQVTRRENAGEHLKHDHVVRLYQPVQPWPGAQSHSVQITLPADTARQRVAFVVTDSGSTRPRQALALRCP